MSEEPRSVAARVIPEVFDEEWLRDYLESIKNLSRGYPVDHKCSECGKRQKVYVHVPDFKNINESVLDLWNQAFGRPGTAEGEPGGVVFVIERVDLANLEEDAQDDPHSDDLQAVGSSEGLPPQ